MDILVNNADNYLVLININSRFAVLESISDITIASIFIVLKSLLKKLKIEYLESDEKASFASKSALKYLDKKNVNY
jgi:hypothetical protein